MWLGLVVMGFVALGLSRFFVAVHTLDNIVFGWLLGTWAALSYHYLIAPLIHENLTTTLKIRMLAIVVTCLWTFAMLLCILVYFYVDT